MVDTFGAASPEGSPVPVGGGAASGSRLEGAIQGRSDRPAPAGVSDELADPQYRLPTQGDSVWRM